MPAKISIWAPLPPSLHLRRPVPGLPFPLEEPGCRLVAWARHGIWAGARAIGLRPADAVLTPAYHHGSEVEALLEAGMECRFYDAGPDLAPEPAALETLLDERVRALHLTHVLGFPQDAGFWRRWCDERGLRLIEDAAQAWLAQAGGRPAGSWGDLAVFCLYKSIGLSEGAAVLARPPTPAVPIDPRLGLQPLALRHASWVASRSSPAYRAGRLLRPSRGGPPSARRDFELRDPTVGPWRHTRYILRRLADPAVAERRRRHFAALARELGDLLPSPFDGPLGGASPFAFPVHVHDKERVLRALREARIGHFDFWAVPHPELRADRFPAAAERRAHTVALPVHQELRPRDLARIAAVVRRAVV